MGKLTLLHTAEVHKTTFDNLRDRIAPEVELEHIVRPDWLESARKDGLTETLEADISSIISSAGNRVLCSCTSIGQVAEKSGAIRIDRPMMEAASKIGGPILLVYALQSTATSSLQLLQEACEKPTSRNEIHTLWVADAWHHFEAGDMTKFASTIATETRQKLHSVPETTSVVLAQASMAGAALLLTDIPQTVFTSPETALRAAMDAVEQ